MLEELKRRVYKANMMLPKYRLVTFTWGNASEIDSATGLVAIKPSGVPYDELSPEKMVLITIFKEMWLKESINLLQICLRILFYIKLFRK